MKKLRILTISALLLAGGATTFTSCGGGGEKEEKPASDTGYAFIKQMMDALDEGDIEMGVSDANDIKKALDIKSDDDDYISLDKNFDGYSYDENFTIEDGVLNSISCNTFYDDDKKKEAKKDAEEILEYLKELLGKPESDSNKFYDWTFGDYEISFNIFEDGYSLYVDPPYDYDADMDYDSDSDNDGCVGDFYNLKKDLKDIFLANIKSGSMKIGSTTKAQMKSMTGDDSGFTKEYDGLRVSGYYSFNGDVLSSITLDYFYECDGALSLLDMDKGDISDAINEGLGVTGEKDGDYDDAGTNWSISGQTVRQANFSDGYGIYFEK